MFKFVQINFSRSSLSRGNSFLNNLLKNGLNVCSPSTKFSFSTINNLNNEFSQQNSFSYVNDLIRFNSSSMFSEFGAKKKSSVNENIADEVIEHKTEKLTEKSSKKSTPINKPISDSTKKTLTKSKKQNEKEKMEKADKNANKNKNGEKKTKVVSTINEIDKNGEGNFL